MSEKEKFLALKSDLTYEKYWKIGRELDELEWSNIIGKVSNKEFIEQYEKYIKRIFKNSLGFGKDIQRFTKTLISCVGKEKAKKILIHEMRHVKYYEESGVNYVFGIIKYKDGKEIQPFTYSPYEETMLLDPRERILFLIGAFESPEEDMSEGDEDSASFWKNKLKEFDKLNKNSKDTSQ